MPYITQDLRIRLKQDITNLSSTINEITANNPEQIDGIWNYIFTRIIVKTLPKKNYHFSNMVVGVLECCKLEFYRRVIGPYEKTKIFSNGDVYGENDNIDETLRS